ncbi:MAG TPA: FliM/FliN family flagellar motor switch protein [Steroidobacteraceae bacterium]
MNAPAFALPETDAILVTPLSHSARLPGISTQAVALARLYSHGALQCAIDETCWRFRWRYIDTALHGVELRLRVGGLEAMLLLEDLAPFGTAIDATHPEVPAALRAAFLLGLAASCWQQLETLTGRTVEVVGVQPDFTMAPTPDCIGFEVGVEPRGVSTRGFLRPLHPELPGLLLEVSQREMPVLSPSVGLRLRWSAIVGSTTLSAGEVSSLEEQDIVVIDAVAYAAEGLTCRLGVGAGRRDVGRVLLRRGGQLQLLEFNAGGQMIMTSSDADTALPDETRFDDIPVSLRFELVRWEAPLAEVAGLRAGSVIELGQRIDEQSVTVWVEQRCIGKGQLVAVGERLGVRLVSVLAQKP